MSHYRSEQIAKGDHKSLFSLQVNWLGVVSQVTHCRSQQVSAGAEGHHKSAHITPGSCRTDRASGTQQGKQGCHPSYPWFHLGLKWEARILSQDLMDIQLAMSQSWAQC